MKNKTIFLERHFFNLMLKHAINDEFEPNGEDPDAGRGVWSMEIPKWLSILTKIVCRESPCDVFQKVCDEADGI